MLNFARPLWSWLGGRIRSFFVHNPEAIRAKNEARLAAENAENERVNARRVVLNEYVRVKGEATTAILNAKTARTQVRGQAKVDTTHARQSFWTVLLDHWARYRLQRQRNRTARIHARADAKAKRRESKIAYRRAKQELKEEKEEKSEAKFGIRTFSFGILLIMAILFVATMTGVALHLNWLWPLSLWLLIWWSIRVTTGWRMKTINVFVVVSWAIATIGHFKEVIYGFTKLYQ